MASITGSWYQAEYATTAQTGNVGGAIDEGNAISGLLDEVFPAGASRFLGRPVYEQFRKVYFKNTGNEVTEAVVFWQDLQHVDHMRFAFEQVADDTSTADTMPAGYVTGDFYGNIGLVNGVDVPGGTIAASTGQVGLWIWQRIPNGLPAETGAIATIRIAGVVGA